MERKSYNPLEIKSVDVGRIEGLAKPTPFDEERDIMYGLSDFDSQEDNKLEEKSNYREQT